MGGWKWKPKIIKTQNKNSGCCLLDSDGVWRHGDDRSIGGSNRSSWGSRGAADRLAVGVGGDCGEHVLVVGYVCIFTCVTCVKCWLKGEAVTREAWAREGRLLCVTTCVECVVHRFCASVSMVCVVHMCGCVVSALCCH